MEEFKREYFLREDAKGNRYLGLKENNKVHICWMIDPVAERLVENFGKGLKSSEEKK